MKRLLLAAIILSVIAGTFMGLFVGGREGVSPEDQVGFIVSEYLSAWQELQPQKMYDYISRSDKTSLSRDQYIEQFMQFPVRPIKYEIVSISVTGQSARAKLLIDWPELEGSISLSREELFFLIREDYGWKILEEGSLQY